MAPGGLGKGRLAERRTVRQCRIFRKNAARENTDARCGRLPHRSIAPPSLRPHIFHPSG